MKSTRRYLKKSSSVIDDILDDHQPREKISKKPYQKPLQSTEIPDEDWSDDEKDWNQPISTQSMTKNERKDRKDDENQTHTSYKQIGKKVITGEIRINDGDEYEE